MTILPPSTSSAIPHFHPVSALALPRSASILGGDDDHDDDPPPSPSVPAGPAVSSTQPSPAGSRKRGDNFYLADARGLARNWKQRARDYVAAVRLASQVEAEQRPATIDEQRQLIRFTGFGATELANGVFRRPGENRVREGLGRDRRRSAGCDRRC